MLKEATTQFDFEQRVSISRDYQGSRRKKKSKKSSKKPSKRHHGRQDDEESIVSGISGARHDPVSATVSVVCVCVCVCFILLVKCLHGFVCLTGFNYFYTLQFRMV